MALPHEIIEDARTHTQRQGGNGGQIRLFHRGEEAPGFIRFRHVSDSESDEPAHPEQAQILSPRWMMDKRSLGERRGACDGSTTFFGGQPIHTIVCSIIIEPIFITSKSTHFIKRHSEHLPINQVSSGLLTIWDVKNILTYGYLEIYTALGYFV